MKYVGIILFFFTFSFSDTHFVNKVSKYDHIFKKYEKEYGVPYILMKAIALTENSKFDSKAIMKNSNNTQDVGLMQINSKWSEWMPHKNITIEKLKDPDFNIKIAFIITKDLIEKYGYSWETVGRYHSSTHKFKKRWLARLKENMKLLKRTHSNIVVSAL